MCMALRYYLDAALMFARALRLDPSGQPEVEQCALDILSYLD